MIMLTDKKNEVDELTENVGILFNKDILDETRDKEIFDAVNCLAQKKAKDYPSLSNKAIFKYMDMIDLLDE